MTISIYSDYGFLYKTKINLDKTLFSVHSYNVISVIWQIIRTCKKTPSETLEKTEKEISVPLSYRKIHNLCTQYIVRIRWKPLGRWRLVKHHVEYMRVHNNFKTFKNPCFFYLEISWRLFKYYIESWSRRFSLDLSIVAAFRYNRWR